jgi:TOMM system kinase/cyclase fusion protein
VASSSGREAERFRREAQICAALSHPNIVPLIDSGETAAGQLYAVFAHVPGETLAEALARDGRLELREALRLLGQVLEALGSAHARGVVHRDVKPANVMLSDSGVRRSALVLDFGLGGVAEGRRRKEWQTLTQSREFLGTPLYAAPEQLFGEPATPRSDLYAWGLVFLECLTGRHPFAEEGAAARLLSGGGAVVIPEWLREHRLGELLAAVTMREAEKRDVSAESLVEALDEIAARELPVAPEVSPAPAPLAESGERRHLTVMFCDLVDSTGLTQRLDAESYRQLMWAYQARAAEAVERYGGHVAQYLGDGLLVYFGHPQAHEDDAERAVRAGREVLRGLEVLNPRLEAEHGVALAARIGVHTGPAVVGEMGSGATKEVLALGDTPNIAARLEAFAEPGTLVISEATRRLVAGLFVTEDRGTPELKGIAEPLRVYRVLQPSGVTSRLDRAARLTPFVGRAEELALLHARFERAQEGQGQAVLIGGEAGIGKSRLVHRLREKLREHPHSWLECRTSAYTQSSAFRPVIELLEQALGFEEGQASEEKVERLERGLAHAGLDPEEAVPLFASLLSLRLPERYAPLEISPQLQRQKTLEALLAWVLALGEKQPVVLLVEDLHWADPSTLEWLGLLIEQCPTARVLLLPTFRPDFEPTWPGRDHVLALRLNRLNPRHAKELVAAAISGEALPGELVDRLATRSDGIPFFVEELAKGAVEAGLGQAGPLAGLEIPETLQDSLMARLDRLGDAKQVAQLGSAIGREFPFALLKAVAPLKEVALREGLGRLAEAELLYQRGLPPKAVYTFKHALLQDTAYESLLESQRRELHGRIADALEKHFPDRVAREPEEIARHLEKAGRGERAIAHYRRAGERAVHHSAHPEAIAHLHRAMELLGALPESTERDRQELALYTTLGEALALSRGVESPEVEQLYARARQLSEQLSDATELFRTLDGLAAMHWGRAEWERARELEEELLRLAQETGDPAQLLVGYWNVANGSYYRGDFLRARRHAAEAIKIYDPEDYRNRHYPYNRADAGIVALGVASHALWQLGYPAQALAKRHEAQALARDLADPLRDATVLTHSAELRLFRREYPAALEEAEALVEFGRDRGFLFHLAVGAIRRAQALALLGQLDEGIAGILATLDASRATGLHWGASHWLAELARALGRAGRVEEGLSAAAEARAFVTRTQERFVEAEVHRIQGDLFLTLPTPDPPRAEAAFREALEVARRQSARSWELRAATSLAHLLRGQGRRDEARALLQPVYDWFTEGFDTADLKDAKALLGELT